MGARPLLATSSGDDNATCRPHVDEASEGRDRICGVLLAMASGIFMGFQALPYKLSSDHDPVSYSLGQSIGQFLVILVIYLGGTIAGVIAVPQNRYIIGCLAGLA